MRIHILGIGGTFMSGIALIAKQLGHTVSGSDANVYPPVSTELQSEGIHWSEGYRAEDIPPDVDYVIVGNVVKRGNPAMEYLLNQKIPFYSGPEWLAKNILQKKWVLAVSGTHGKTTTTSLLAWILESAGLNPSFLVGGVPENFGVSARLTDSPFFVIEADEYDSAFFDKRSKFLHYHPKTLILNNLEFDHADIFPTLAAIQQQFHYLIRTVPGNGLILQHAQDVALQEMLALGCWSPIMTFGEEGAWQAELMQADGSVFQVTHLGVLVGAVSWALLGSHNVHNALAAIAAAEHAGVRPADAVASLSSFKNVKRRLEVTCQKNNIVIYDDFAHHPTAIATTLAGLRAKIGASQRLVAVLEFGSYTMRTGVHKDRIKQALADADMVVCKIPDPDWGVASALSDCSQQTLFYPDVETLVAGLGPELRPGDHVVVMSNSGFGGVHEKLASCL